MKKKIISVAMAMVLAGLAMASQPSAVHAREALSISPLRQEFVAKPGDTLQGAVSVTNVGTSARTVTVVAMDFEVADEGGYPQFSITPIGGPGYSLAGWTTIGKESLTVPPGETVEAPFNISVPQNAEPGGHYAGILIGAFSPEDSEVEGGTTVAIGSAVASLILLTVEGEII